MRDSSLVEAHVRAILISKKVTQEGEVMPYAQTELSVSVEGSAMLICLKLKCHLFRNTTTIHLVKQEMRKLMLYWDLCLCFHVVQLA